METSSRIGQRVHAARVERGLSMSELARRAGVGKGSLSEIEGGGRVPTIETLYALCGAFGLPMTALIGDVTGTHSEAAGGMRSVLLSTRDTGRSLVEVFRLQWPAGAGHTSPPHSDGARESVTVIAGSLELSVAEATVEVATGQTHAFAADVEHRYRAPQGAEAIDVIITPR